MSAREAVRRIHFDPTINMGHLISAGSFICVGIALYIGIAVTVKDNTRRISHLESYDFSSLQRVTDQREVRVNMLERSMQSQGEMNAMMLEKLTSLDTNVAVLAERLRGFDATSKSER